MDPVVSVQSKNCSGNTKELAKVLGAEWEALSHLHQQLLGSWQSLWRSFLERLYVDTTQIQNTWIAERAVRRVKEGSSAILLQSGLDENRWAYSMECYTYLRNFQDLLSNGKSIRKGFWRTISRTDHSVWFTGWVLPCFCERQVKNHSLTTWIVPWIRSERGWI